MITKEKLIDSVEKIISLNHPPLNGMGENGNTEVYGGKCLKDFVMVWCQFSAYEDFGIEWEETDEIFEVINQLLGTYTCVFDGVSESVNFAVSGAEMRQVMNGDFLSIYWEWDGTSIFIPRDDLPRFRERLNSYIG